MKNIFFGEIEPRKIAKQNTQYVKSGISENTYFKKVIIEKKLESINLSAKNGTYWQAQIESLGQYHIQPTSDSIWALK